MNFNKHLKMTTHFLFSFFPIFFFFFFYTSFVVLKIWPNFSKILAKVVEFAQNKPQNNNNNNKSKFLFVPPKQNKKLII